MDYIGMGCRICAMRKQRGLSQEKLAELIDRSCSFTGHIERGTRKPSLETLVEIAVALSCSADDLLGIKKRQLSREEELSLILHEALNLVES